MSKEIKLTKGNLALKAPQKTHVPVIDFEVYKNQQVKHQATSRVETLSPDQNYTQQQEQWVYDATFKENPKSYILSVILLSVFAFAAGVLGSL